MRKPFFSVVSNSASTAGEILIYGIIGPDFWNDGIEARSFVQALQYLAQKYNRINVRINSPGGSVWDGLAIFNAIRSSEVEVHTYNDGVAFSMAMIILLAGKTVHVAKGSIGMLHNAGGGADGNAQDMREAATMLDKHDEVLADLIAEKTGLTIEEVNAKWMDYKDHFMTAQEMVDAGLADVIEDYSATDMPADPQNMSLHQVAAFYTERMEEPSPSLLTKIITHVTNLTNPSNMKFPNIFAFVGVTKPTQAQLDEANAELTEAGITGVGIYPESIVTDAATATAEVTRLTGEVTALTTRATTAETALATATTNAATAASAAATKIIDLEGQVAAFGDNAGALHQNNDGDDVHNDETDYEALLANMPHNRAADALTGKPKPKATA